MLNRGDSLKVTLLTFACACGGVENRNEEGERVGSVAQQLHAGGDVLGFEVATAWRGPGPKSLSTLHTQGQRSLALRPNNYSRYDSAAFELAGELRSVSLDLQLPTTQPNPSWYGAVQFYATCVERRVHSAYLGQVELTGRPLGAFTTLEVTVPAAIRSQLGSGCRALEIGIVLNVPGTPGQYLLDNLRLRTELLAWYEMNDGAARVTDTSGYDRHGTLVGGATIIEDPERGSVLSLNGTSAYADLPPGILDAASDVTVASWVKLSQLGAWSRIFDFGGASGFLYLTPNTHDGRMRYAAFTSFDREGIVTSPGLPVGAWKHVAVTARGREYRLYVDGIEAGSALGEAVSPAPIGSGSGQWLGRSRFPDPFLSGALDDFRVYDRALSQKEVAELARPQASYAHYSFDDSTAGILRDDSQLALHGALIGSGATEPGIIDRALRLTGGHVRLPPGVVESCADFTFSAWTKLRQNRPWNRVFDFGSASLDSFMYLSPAGFGAAGQELRFGLVTPVGIHDLGFPFLAPLEEWTHLGVTVRGNTATLFLNGRAAASRSDVTSKPSDMGLTLQNSFGKSLFPDPTFDGALDDVRFSCRAYDPRELAQLAHVPLPAQPPLQRALTGDLTHVHDPAIIAASGGYYLFSTGPGILTRYSPDLSNVAFTGQVFAEHPAWVQETFGAIDSLWAPDISFFGGQYHLYYSASTFGVNRSCIGHATKASLTSADPWTDHGPVICSNMNGSVDDFNAIDPNVVVDASGAAWLSFGSFWGGLQLIPLTAEGERAGTTITNIAKGPGTAVEAPFIVYRAPYYYLFASFDLCCRGTESTYRQVVGRSTSVTGPYLDRTGLPMLQAGGTPVVSGSSRFRGPGHNALISALGQSFNVYHAYDASNGGIPTLRISPLQWHDGWPVNAEP